MVLKAADIAVKLNFHKVRYPLVLVVQSTADKWWFLMRCHLRDWRSRCSVKACSILLLIFTLKFLKFCWMVPWYFSVKAQNVYITSPKSPPSNFLECTSAIDSCPGCMIYFCLIVSCFVVLTSHLSRTMGKKSRVKTQKSGTGASTVVSPKEMMNLISELLQSMFMLHLSLVWTVGIHFCCVPNYIKSKQFFHLIILRMILFTNGHLNLKRDKLKVSVSQPVAFLPSDFLSFCGVIVVFVWICHEQSAAVRRPLLVKSGRSTSRLEVWWRRSERNRRVRFYFNRAEEIQIIPVQVWFWNKLLLFFFPLRFVHSVRRQQGGLLLRSDVLGSGERGVLWWLYRGKLWVRGLWPASHQRH